MSQENMELTYRAFDAFNRRDLAAGLSLTDNDVEAVPRAARMEGSYHGHEGVRRWWDDLLSAIPDFTVEVGEVRAFGDLTVAPLHLRGMCVWWRTFDTRAEAFGTNGLSV